MVDRVGVGARNCSSTDSNERTSKWVFSHEDTPDPAPPTPQARPGIHSVRAITAAMTSAKAR